MHLYKPFCGLDKKKTGNEKRISSCIGSYGFVGGIAG
jgi:hypothetical protein